MAMPGAELTGKPTLAVALSDAWQRAQITDALTSFYALTHYSDMSQTLAGCRRRPPLLALVSETLPLSGGYDLVHMLRLDPRLASIPVVMLVAAADGPTRDRVAQCRADGLLVAPFDRSDLIGFLSRQINRGIERTWQILPPLQRQALSETLHMFNGLSDLIAAAAPLPYRAVSDACAPLVEAIASNDYRGVLQGVRNHDNYAYAHSVRVATYLALFGSTLGLAKDEQVVLATGGLLHDIGKMSIPHGVLNKPGRLNDAELLVMRGHVTASNAYLQRCPGLPKGVVTIAAQHHEKLDGTGYPLGLAGKELNRLARIASIVDVFSALTDRRVYKPAMDAETALSLMVNQMSAHLDITLLVLFRQMLLDATP